MLAEVGLLTSAPWSCAGCHAQLFMPATSASRAPPRLPTSCSSTACTLSLALPAHAAHTWLSLAAAGVIKLGEQQADSKVTLVYGQMNEPPGEACLPRLRVLVSVAHHSGPNVQPVPQAADGWEGARMVLRTRCGSERMQSSHPAGRIAALLPGCSLVGLLLLSPVSRCPCSRGAYRPDRGRVLP